VKAGLCDEKESSFCFIFFSDSSPLAEGIKQTINVLLPSYSNDPILFTYAQAGSHFASYFNSAKVVIYKPKRRKYVTFENEINSTNLKAFIDSIISGGGSFKNLKQVPSFKVGP
jgi:hypothetical protein